MKVIFSDIKSQISFNTLTSGKFYDVIDYSVFGNRSPEYKIVNDIGNEIWVSSESFIKLQEMRNHLLDKIINQNVEQ